MNKFAFRHAKNKFLFAIIAFVALFGATAFGGNSGLKPAPQAQASGFQVITTEEEFANFAKSVNEGTGNFKKIRLGANLNLGEKIWTPIGTLSQPFKGEFDGNGYVISNLKIDSTITVGPVGFFGVVEGATIQDFVLQNTFISSSQTRIGPVVGLLKSGTIRNVAVEEGVVQGESGTTTNIGGLVGEVDSGTTKAIINNSFSSAKLLNSRYAGGIVGASKKSAANLEINNVYFSGSIINATYMRGIIYNNNATIRSSYFVYGSGSSADSITVYYHAYYKANGSGVSDGYKNSKTSAEAIIKAINLNDFHDVRRANGGLNVGNNWIKLSSGQMPVLRGVGNSLLALKQSNGFDDYINNASTVYNFATNLSQNQSVTLSVSDSELTWRQVSYAFRLSGTTTLRGGVASPTVETSTPTQRFDNASKVITSTKTSPRQGYMPIVVTEQGRLFKHTVTLSSVSDKGLLVPGKVRLYNNSSGVEEIYFGGSANQPNSSSKQAVVNGWTEDLTIGGQTNQISIFAKKGAVVSFYALPQENFYHSLFIDTDTPDASTVSAQNFQITLNTVNKTDKTKPGNNIKLLVSDLYELDYDETNAGFNATNFPFTNYGERAISGGVSEVHNIFVSYSSLNIYVNGKTQNPNNTSAFAGLEAAGWAFRGWALDVNGQTMPVSSGRSSYFNGGMPSSMQTDIKNKLLGQRQLLPANLRNPFNTSLVLYTQDSSMRPLLFPIWDVGEYNVSFSSYLNLSEDFDISELESALQTRDKQIPESYVKNGKHGGYYKLGQTELFSDTRVQVSENVFGNFVIDRQGAVVTQTGGVVTITTNKNDTGIEIHSAIIYNMNIKPTESSELLRLQRTRATFNQNYTYNNAQWYQVFPKDGLNFGSLEINHVHGDIGVIVLYKRAETNINIDINQVFNGDAPSQPTEFSVDYDIVEVNGVAVKSGTVTTSNKTVPGILVGQTVVLKNLKLSPNFDFSNSPEQRFINNNNYPDYESSLGVHYLNSVWTIDGIEKAVKFETGDNPKQDYNLGLDVNIKHKGIKVNFIAARQENGQLESLSTLNLGQDLPDFRVINVNNGGSSFTPYANGNQVENLAGTGRVEFTFGNQHLYTFYNEEAPANIKVYVNGQIRNDIVLSYNKSTKVLSNFQAFLQNYTQGDEIEVFFVFEKTKYTINIVKTGMVEGGGVNHGANKDISQLLNVEYDKTYLLEFEESLGYEIKQARFENIALNLSAIQIGLYGAELKLSSQELSSTAKKGTTFDITVEFAGKPTWFKIEHYEVDLGGQSNSLRKTSEAYPAKFGETVVLDQAYAENFVGFWFNSESSEMFGKIVVYVSQPDQTGIQVFKFYYERQIINVYYNANTGGGTAPSPHLSVEFNNTITLSENTLTKAGYTFEAWATNSSGPQSQNNFWFRPGTNMQLTVTPEILALAGQAGNLTLYARWLPRTINATWHGEQQGENTNVAVSSTWDRANGYTTFANQKYATSVLTFGQPYTQASGVANDDVLRPYRQHYTFMGWYTQPNGQGTKIEKTTIVNLDTQDQVSFYAHWQPESTKIVFNTNLAGAYVSFGQSHDSLTQVEKFVYVDNLYISADINGEKQGFPNLFNHQGFVFDGWYSSNQAKQGQVTQTSVVANTSTKVLYAHWKVVSPVIVSPENWESVLDYTGFKIQNAPQIEFAATQENAYVSNTNASNLLTYQYQWYRLVEGQDVLLEGQTDKMLSLQDVNQSGQYKAKVTATNQLWGSGEAFSDYVTVTINKLSLYVTPNFTGGKIAKTYNGTTSIGNVEVSNPLIFEVTGDYDSPDAGVEKAVTFTVNFNPDHSPENYQVFYVKQGVNHLMQNSGNNQSFTYTDNTGVGTILKYKLTLEIKDTKPQATQNVAVINASEISMLPADQAFFLNQNVLHMLKGQIKTNNNLPGEYFAPQDFDFSDFDIVKISNQNSQLHNYEITFTGKITIQLLQEGFKTLTVDKFAILDKQLQQQLPFVSDGLTIRLNLSGETHSISNTGIYEIQGYLIYVVNHDNSGQATIKISEEFNGSIELLATSQNVVVAGVTTSAVPVSWQLEGVNINQPQAVVDFSVFDNGSTNQINLIYQNYSIIHYNTQISGADTLSQSVYNTLNGVNVVHLQPNFDHTGLTFLGWFNSTLPNAQLIPNNWKGVGNINVYAKWEIEQLQVELTLDETSLVTQQIMHDYDGLTHTVVASVKNLNTNVITYNYEWTEGGQAAGSGQEFSYKDARNTKASLTVTATVNLVSGTSLVKQTTKAFDLVINKHFFDPVATDPNVAYLEKQFDNTSALNINGTGQDYYVFNILLPSGVQEQIVMRATYATMFVEDSPHALENISFEDTETGKMANYRLPLQITGITGKIVPRPLAAINLDLALNTPHTKVYDGQPLEKVVVGPLSQNLIVGHEIRLSIKTSSADAGLYSGKDIALALKVYDNNVERTKNYTFSFDSIVGNAEILQAQIDASKIRFGFEDSFVFDGKEKFVYVNLDELPGKTLPPNASFKYTWYKGTDQQNQINEQDAKPVYVGSYTIVYTLNISDVNYQIIGQHPIKKTFQIIPKPITISIGNKVLTEFSNIVIPGSGVAVEGLESQHTITGTVWPTGSLTNKVYSSSNNELAWSIVIKDENNKTITENYTINVVGSILVEHIYTIVYNHESQSSEQIIYHGTPFNLRAAQFQKDGYVFDKWTTNPDGTGQEFENQQQITQALAPHGGTFNLHAQWRPGLGMYYLEYYLEELDATYSLSTYQTLNATTENYVVYNITNQLTLTVSIYENQQAFNLGQEPIDAFEIQNHYEGFWFANHENQQLSGVVTPSSSESGSLVIKLYLSRNSYDITFNFNNGDPNQTLAFKFEQIVDFPPNPTRAGYNFQGWSTVVNSQTVAVEMPYKMPARSHTVQAVYVPNTDTEFLVKVHYQTLSGDYDLTAATPLVFKGTTGALVKFVFDQTGARLQMLDSETNQILQDNMFEKPSQETGFYLNQEVGQASDYQGFIVYSEDLENMLLLNLYYSRNQYTFTKQFHNTQPSQQQTLFHGTIITQPASPTFVGYTFEGWYLNYSAGIYTEKISLWNFPITKHTTIHARYTPNTNTKFVVNIYQELLTGGYNQTPDVVLDHFTSTTNYYAVVLEKQNEGTKYFVVQYYLTADMLESELVGEARLPETEFSAYGFVIDTSKPAPSTVVMNDGSGVINVYLARQLFVLTLNLNYGTTPHQQLQIKYGHQITKAYNSGLSPSREGYIFGEWYESASYLVSELVAFPLTITKDLTLYARWYSELEVPVTVNFYFQTVSGQVLDYPQLPQITEKLTAAHESFVFVKPHEGEYWVMFYPGGTENPEEQEAEASSRKVDFAGYTYSSHTLAGNGEYAGYPTVQLGIVIEIYYTINQYNFIINFKDQSTENQLQQVYFGQKPSEVSNPVRDGYVFEGWFTDESYITPYVKSTFTMPANAVTIYALWSEAPDTQYMVEYYHEDLSESQNKTYTLFETVVYANRTNSVVKVNQTELKIEVWTKIEDEIVESLDVKSFIGFTLDTSITGTVNTTIILANPQGVIKLYFARNAHDLTLNFNYSSDDQLYAGVQPTHVYQNILYGQTQHLQQPVRAGYQFSGWFANQALTERAAVVVFEGGHNFVMPDAHTTLYAGWSANLTEYEVNYYFENINDTNFTISPAETRVLTGRTDSVVEGEKLMFAGFTYSQSHTDENGLSSGKVGAYSQNALVLNVYYTRNYYNLHFEGRGNTGGAMQAQSFKYQQQKPLSENSFVREGYAFVGWTENEQSQIKNYDNKENFHFTAQKDITIYAIWRLNNPGDVTLTASSQSVQYGDTLTLTVSTNHDFGQEATFSYSWFKLNQSGGSDPISHSQSSLELTQISQSGTYFVRVRVYKQGDTVSTLTNQAEVQILPRDIKVVWDYSQFTFSNTPQAPQAQVVALDQNGDITLTENQILLPSVTVQLYSQGNLVTSTVDVGQYQAVAQVQQNANFNFITSSENHAYEILQLDWHLEIAAGQFRQEYNPLNQQFTFVLRQSNSKTGQLVEVYLQRLNTGQQIGFYNLTLQEPQSNNNNYLITINQENQGFEIYTSSSTVEIMFVNSSLFTKQYDGNQIDLNHQMFTSANVKTVSGSQTITFTQLEFEIVGGNSKNAGIYQIKLKQALSVEYENIVLAGSYNFVITQKQVNLDLESVNLQKTYDGSTAWQIDTAFLVGVLSQDESGLSLPIRFTSPNAGENIAIERPVLEGPESDNYVLSSQFNNLTGSILKRNVKVVAKNVSITYGNYVPGMFFDFDAHAQSLLQPDDYTEPVSHDLFTGNLLPYFADEFESVGQFELLLGSLTISSNYNLQVYQSALLTVNQKTLTVAASSWDKVYDGTTLFLGDIELIGVLERDKNNLEVVATYLSANVSDNAQINLTLQGAGHENYKLASQEFYGKIEDAFVKALLNYNLNSLRSLAPAQIAQTELTLVYGQPISNSYPVLPIGSVVGYNFMGWFVVVDGTEQQVTPATVINNSIGWQPSQSQKEFFAKWEEAQVNLTVNIILQDSNTVTYFNMEQANTFEHGIVTINSASITQGNKVVLPFASFANVSASANPDYELEYLFDGWFLSAVGGGSQPITSSQVFEVDGNNLEIEMLDNFEIYVRFKLKTTSLTLNFNANGQQVEVATEFLSWQRTTQGSVLTALTKQFDSGTVVLLPSVLYTTGYTFMGWFYDPQDTSNPLTQVTVINQTNVYAVWQAQQFEATFIASTGTDTNPADKHFDNGKVEATGQQSFTKTMQYNSNFGSLETVTRKRFTFAGWFDNPQYTGEPYTQSSVWTFTSNLTFYAKWQQEVYTVSFEVLNHQGGEVSFVEGVGITDVWFETAGQVTTYTVQLLSTSTLNALFKANNGYVFNLEADYQNHPEFDFEFTTQNQNSSVMLSRLASSQTLQVAFYATLNTITIDITTPTLGTVTASVENFVSTGLRSQQIQDDMRVTIVSQSQVQVKAFTGETIVLDTAAQTGYLYEKTVNISQTKLNKSEHAEISGAGDKVSIANFYDHQWFEASFTERTHTFVVQVGQDKTTGQTSARFGSFALWLIEADQTQTPLETNPAQTNTYTEAQVKTGQSLKIEVVANNGFKVSQNSLHYQLENSASFNFGQLAENIIIIEDIYSDNSLTLVFERVLYQLNKAVLIMHSDGTQTLVEQPSQQTALIEVAQLPDFADSQFYFETALSLSAQVNQEKYTFVGWATQQDGRVVSSSSVFDLEIVQPTMVYLVIQLNVYTVTYSTQGRGTLSGDSTHYVVEHGSSLNPVEATPEIGHHFVSWQIYNPQLSQWENDTQQTTSLRQELDITKSMQVRAVFDANQITVTVNSNLIIDTDLAGNYVYYDGQQQVGQIAQQGTQEWFTTKQITIRTDQELTLVTKTQKGYSLNNWSRQGQVQMQQLAGGAMVFAGYVDNVTVTAIFETNINTVSVGFVNVQPDQNGNVDYTFGNNKSEGGKVNIFGGNVQKQNTSLAIAKVKSGQVFEFLAVLNTGYKFNLRAGQQIAAVGVKNQEGQITLLDNVVADLEANSLEGVLEGVFENLEIVVFVELIKYKVTFHIISDEQPEQTQEIELTVEDSVTAVLEQNQILLPQRQGHDFAGWFFSPTGNSINNTLINANGNQISAWTIDKTDVYAQWTRKIVNIKIEYQPGTYAFNGQAVVNSVADLAYLNNLDEFGYYVGLKNKNTDVLLEAHRESPGYKFVGWYKDGALVSSSHQLALTFSHMQEQFQLFFTLVYSVQLEVLASSNGEGFVNNQKQVYLLPGQTAQLTAQAAQGYEFKEWQLNGVHYSSQTSTTINYQDRASNLRPIFEGKKVEVILQQTNGGQLQAWLSANRDSLLFENGKYYARMGQILHFEAIADEGMVHTGFVVNSIERLNPNYRHAISVEDTEKQAIEVAAQFSIKQFNYTISLTSGGRAKVADKEFTGENHFSTDYFSTINFTFWATERHMYSEAYILVDGTRHSISSNHIQFNQNTYIVSFPSNLFGVDKQNVVKINFEKLYWLDVREMFEGAGTEANPYIISNAKQFAQMAYFVNNNMSAESGKVDYAMAYYLLIAPVDFSERFWVPIGTQENPFDGTIKLDYSRINIFLDKPYSPTQQGGLFGHVTNRANIIVKQIELKTGVWIILGVGAMFGAVSAAFVLRKRIRRKKLLERSRTIATERRKKL